MRDLFDPRELVVSDRVAFEGLRPLFPRRPSVRILVVTDTEVGFSSSFGIGRVVDLIRENVDGYVHFDVDLARLGVQGSSLSVNDTPSSGEPRYTNFRFSSQRDGRLVVEEYDQLWCFGFAPGNDGSSNDDNIWNDEHATSDADLSVITQWMNAGGGMLAMGDHHYLGAAMCGRIPRVRSMRAWTNAQGVPPIGGPGRFDTNQPQSTLQDPESTPTPQDIPNAAQRDGVPQTIQWKRYAVPAPLFVDHRYRPHALLCGGELGVLDVLPDHPHEGFVVEDTEVPLAGTYAFAGAAGDEYPTVGAVQAKPEVIAWANTRPDPPYHFRKGDTPARRFGVIGAYDGDRVDVGRVVVDSTWHHWMDMNLRGLEAERPDTDYQKIVRYFRNCAVWLAREGQRRQMLAYSAFWATLHASAFEDLRLGASIFELGAKGMDVLGRLTSDCMVRDFIGSWIPEIVREELQEPRLPPPEPCWSCPPLELVQRAVLGGVLQEILPLRDELQRLHEDPHAKLSLSPDAVALAVSRGAQKGLEVFHVVLERNMSRLEVLRRLSDHPCKPERSRKAVSM